MTRMSLNPWSWSRLAEEKTRLAIPAFTINDQGPRSRQIEDGGGRAFSVSAAGTFGPRHVPFVIEVRPAGIEENGLRRPPQVFALLERDQPDTRVLRGLEERLPELAPDEPLDERRMHDSGDDQAERPDGQGLPQDPPRFAQMAIRPQP